MYEYANITLATIIQKDVFDHNFWTKALTITILASRSVFLIQYDGAICFNLWHWPLKIMTLQ